MAYKFNDEDKEVREYRESIPFGVSKVQFTGAVADATEAGKDFIAIGVVNEAGIEDEARLWFVGGAANISFNTALQIAVHQGKDEEEKASIRDKVDAAADTQELVDILNDVCGNGGELWFTKYYDASRTYTNEHGTFRSINKNVYGYEPKLKPELMPKPADENGDPVSDNVAQTFPGAKAESKDAGAKIPDAWS